MRLLAVVIIAFVVIVLVMRWLDQPITEYPLQAPSQAGAVCTTSDLPLNQPEIVQKRHAAAEHLLWFTDRPGNNMGSMNSSGRVVLYQIPTPNSIPVGCAFGPQDGLLYFAEQHALKLAAFDPLSLKFTEWPIPGPNGGLAGVVFDSNNVLNAMVTKESVIQRMRTDGTFLAPIQLAPGTYPHGPFQCGGNIWFAENTTNRIARLTPDGSVTEKSLPQLHSNPFAVACGKDGVYFTEYKVNKIGRINPMTLDITQWEIPSPGSIPMGLASGYDANIYFAESRANKIGRLSLKGENITEYRVPTSRALPDKVTPCFSSAICFSERGTQEIGVLRIGEQ